MSTDFNKQSWRDHRHYPVMKWLLVLACGMIIAGLVIPAFQIRKALSLRDITASRASEIQDGMGTYAEDHAGVYPSGSTANEIFRQLIVNGYASERPFSGQLSPYRTDNKIGESPNFTEALEPGECHWAVMRGMTVNDPGHLALIFENPVDQSWPPVWHTTWINTPGTPGDRESRQGRAWSGGQIVIGRNDGSIAVELLASKEGDRVPAKDPTLFSHSPDRLLDPPYALPEPRPSP